MMMKLSVIIISKNAQDLIEDCLKSVSFCDEIIVVDAGSTDKTNDIAKKFDAKIITSDTGSFAEQRNVGLEAAKGEWILYIDTDERVTPSLREEIIKVIELSNSSPHPNPLPLERERSEFDAFKIQRRNFYFGNHEWPYIETLERLFKKGNLKKWQGKLHESPVISGTVGLLDGYLLHYTHRDLTSMLKKTVQWSQVEAELRLKDHHPPMTWWRFPRVMLTAFWNSYIQQEGYKAGTAGLVESIYQSFSMFVTYARLWELQQKKF